MLLVLVCVNYRVLMPEQGRCRAPTTRAVSTFDVDGLSDEALDPQTAVYVGMSCLPRHLGGVSTVAPAIRRGAA